MTPGNRRGATNVPFRYRSEEISRFEGFSDAVLAFAVTLLVVSLEVPHTFSELAETMKGFAAFGVCFAMLVGIWYQQYLYFRRYGLQDRFSIILNAVLLFVVLFYVYPLKFLFSMLFGALMGHASVVTGPNGVIEPIITGAQAPTLMIIYGVGYVAVFAIFALLSLHAYRRRDELDLNEIERHDTRTSIERYLIHVAVGFLSILIALIGGPRMAGSAGWFYGVLGPVFVVQSTRARRRRAKVAQAQLAAVGKE